MSLNGNGEAATLTHLLKLDPTKSESPTFAGDLTHSTCCNSNRVNAKWQSGLLGDHDTGLGTGSLEEVPDSSVHSQLVPGLLSGNLGDSSGGSSSLSSVGSCVSTPAELVRDFLPSGVPSVLAMQQQSPVITSPPPPPPPEDEDENDEVPPPPPPELISLDGIDGLTLPSVGAAGAGGSCNSSRLPRAISLVDSLQFNGAAGGGGGGAVVPRPQHGGAPAAPQQHHRGGPRAGAPSAGTTPQLCYVQPGFRVQPGYRVHEINGQLYMEVPQDQVRCDESGAVHWYNPANAARGVPIGLNAANGGTSTTASAGAAGAMVTTVPGDQHHLHGHGSGATSLVVQHLPPSGAFSAGAVVSATANTIGTHPLIDQQNTTGSQTTGCTREKHIKKHLDLINNKYGEQANKSVATTTSAGPSVTSGTEVNGMMVYDNVSDPVAHVNTFSSNQAFSSGYLNLVENANHATSTATPVRTSGVPADGPSQRMSERSSLAADPHQSQPLEAKMLSVTTSSGTTAGNLQEKILSAQEESYYKNRVLTDEMKEKGLVLESSNVDVGILAQLFPDLDLNSLRKPAPPSAPEQGNSASLLLLPQSVASAPVMSRASSSCDQTSLDKTMSLNLRNTSKTAASVSKNPCVLGKKIIPPQPQVLLPLPNDPPLDSPQSTISTTTVIHNRGSGGLLNSGEQTTASALLSTKNATATTTTSSSNTAASTSEPSTTTVSKLNANAQVWVPGGSAGLGGAGVPTARGSNVSSCNTTVGAAATGSSFGASTTGVGDNFSALEAGSGTNSLQLELVSGGTKDQQTSGRQSGSTSAGKFVRSVLHRASSTTTASGGQSFANFPASTSGMATSPPSDLQSSGTTLGACPQAGPMMRYPSRPGSKSGRLMPTASRGKTYAYPPSTQGGGFGRTSTSTSVSGAAHHQMMLTSQGTAASTTTPKYVGPLPPGSSRGGGAARGQQAGTSTQPYNSSGGGGSHAQQAQHNACYLSGPVAMYPQEGSSKKRGTALMLQPTSSTTSGGACSFMGSTNTRNAGSLVPYGNGYSDDSWETWYAENRCFIPQPAMFYDQYDQQVEAVENLPLGCRQWGRKFSAKKTDSKNSDGGADFSAFTCKQHMIQNVLDSEDCSFLQSLWKKYRSAAAGLSKRDPKMPKETSNTLPSTAEFEKYRQIVEKVVERMNECYTATAVTNSCASESKVDEKERSGKAGAASNTARAELASSLSEPQEKKQAERESVETDGTKGEDERESAAGIGAGNTRTCSTTDLNAVAAAPEKKTDDVDVSNSGSSTETKTDQSQSTTSQTKMMNGGNKEQETRGAGAAKKPKLAFAFAQIVGANAENENRSYLRTAQHDRHCDSLEHRIEWGDQVRNDPKYAKKAGAVLRYRMRCPASYANDQKWHPQGANFGCCINLVPHTAWEGGELKFYDTHSAKEPSLTFKDEKQGCGVAFCGCCKSVHEVTPIEKGLRLTLMVWTRDAASDIVTKLPRGSIVWDDPHRKPVTMWETGWGNKHNSLWLTGFEGPDNPHACNREQPRFAAAGSASATSWSTVQSGGTTGATSSSNKMLFSAPAQRGPRSTGGQLYGSRGGYTNANRSGAGPAPPGSHGFPHSSSNFGRAVTPGFSHFSSYHRTNKRTPIGGTSSGATTTSGDRGANNPATTLGAQGRSSVCSGSSSKILPTHQTSSINKPAGAAANKENDAPKGQTAPIDEATNKHKVDAGNIASKTGSKSTKTEEVPSSSASGSGATSPEVLSSAAADSSAAPPENRPPASKKKNNKSKHGKNKNANAVMNTSVPTSNLTSKDQNVDQACVAVPKPAQKEKENRPTSEQGRGDEVDSKPRRANITPPATIPVETASKEEKKQDGDDCASSVAELQRAQPASSSTTKSRKKLKTAVIGTSPGTNMKAAQEAATRDERTIPAPIPSEEDELIISSSTEAHARTLASPLIPPLELESQSEILPQVKRAPKIPEVAKKAVVLETAAASLLRDDEETERKIKGNKEVGSSAAQDQTGSLAEQDAVARSFLGPADAVLTLKNSKANSASAQKKTTSATAAAAAATSPRSNTTSVTPTKSKKCTSTGGEANNKCTDPTSRVSGEDDGGRDVEKPLLPGNSPSVDSSAIPAGVSSSGAGSAPVPVSGLAKEAQGLCKNAVKRVVGIFSSPSSVGNSSTPEKN
ncbi:unnamed protein product [Amoebophrya sp. A120]|nr:unnamed protein product [Amoebophrya sp. A120]|eukprot:GSA120T00006517001.1